MKHYVLTLYCEDKDILIDHPYRWECYYSDIISGKVRENDNKLNPVIIKQLFKKAEEEMLKQFDYINLEEEE